MDYRRLGFGLGLFSVALGAVELVAARRIARALDSAGREALIRGFGVREVAAGVSLLAAPADAANVWSRVAGDALDIAALGTAARRAPGNIAVWGSLVFVLGVTALDIAVAHGLDRAVSARR